MPGRRTAAEKSQLVLERCSNKPLSERVGVKKLRLLLCQTLFTEVRGQSARKSFINRVENAHKNLSHKKESADESRNIRSKYESGRRGDSAPRILEVGDFWWPSFSFLRWLKIKRLKKIGWEM